MDSALAGPGYFESMGIALLAGRGFTTGGREGSPSVAVVNESLARGNERSQDGERTTGSTTLVVRSHAPAAAVLRELRAVLSEQDSRIAIARLSTIEDLLAFALAPALMLTLALATSWLPARHAARTEAAAVLRGE